MEEFKYLIPEESIDAIMDNVSVLRDIEKDLRHLFVERGYLEVLMPSFEYVDLYNDMDIGIDELYSARLKLEGIGLLRSYRSKVGKSSATYSLRTRTSCSDNLGEISKRIDPLLLMRPSIPFEAIIKLLLLKKPAILK